jgi:NADPH:quinone reductase-like Zn-dependent oxidoreductase
MKTVVQSGYGEPAKVLRLVEAEIPTPTEEQVLVRVDASSVNSGDWRRVVGNPAWARPMMGGLRRPKDPHLGGDAAGVVEQVGAAVSHVKPGDEVFGIRTGSFAEYVAGKSFVRKPANLTFEEAAAVPIAALTALQGLRDHGHLQAGQHVLINGAGGGVGHFCVQIAKALGAEVTATTRTDKLDVVRGSGADHVIDYTHEDVTRGSRKFDLVLDMGSPASLSALRRPLMADGWFVQVGAAKGVGGPFGRIISSTLRARLLRQRVTFFIAKPNVPDLETLRELVEAGKLRPIIDRTYALSDIAQAVEYAATERVAGKIAIRVAGSPVSAG